MKTMGYFGDEINVYEKIRLADGGGASFIYFMPCIDLGEERWLR